MVVAQVNTRQDNLLKARPYFASHMLYDRGNAAAARSTTHIGHNTIGAAIVASILYFHLHTGARCQRRPGHCWLYCLLCLPWCEVRRIIRPRLRLVWVNGKQRIAANMLAVKWKYWQAGSSQSYLFTRTWLRTGISRVR